MLLSLLSNASGASTLTLCNDGTATGYELIGGSSFGTPVWSHAFSGTRGTQGSRASSGTLPNRQVVLSIRVTGTTKDDMALKLSTVATAVDQLRRFGGICRMRSKTQTRAQRFDVLTATLAELATDNRLELRNRAIVGINLICGPYVLGDPMDFIDDFSVDNVNGGALNYTAAAGALTNVTVPGNDGMQGSANLTTENRFIYTGSGYTHGDHQGRIKFAPAATISSFKAGVILKWIDASNYLAVYVDDNGTNSRLRIDKVIAGATTNLSSTNLGARVVNGTYAWVRGRIEANTVFAEYFLGNVVPNPIVAATTSNSISLTTAEAAVLGLAVEGKGGIVFTPQSAGAFVDDFEHMPFVYKDPPPVVLDCYGVIPGDAPAIADVRLAKPSAVTTPPWAMLAWARRGTTENRVSNGGFETNATFGWSVAAVSGVTGAASSIAAVSDDTLGVAARYGEYVGQVVCPATANTGATFAVYRRFRAGLTYTATIWVRASAGTTTARLRLGVSGDIASSTAVALSTTWTQHTATWTPTTSVDVAYLAVEVTAATGTTFQIDGAAVYSGATAPATGGQLEGSGGRAPLTVLAYEDEGVTGPAAGMVRTSDANANATFSMADSSAAAGGQTYANSVYVDPGLMDGQDYAPDQIRVNVFARVMLSSAFTGGVTATLSATPEGSTATIYDANLGSAGRRLVLPSSGNSKWRMTRIGTLNLARLVTGGRWAVTVTFVVAAGTNAQAFAVDDVFVLPGDSLAMFPTGKSATSGYPSFLPAATYTHRTIRSDLSSTLTASGSTVAAGGVNGALIELLPGQVSVLAIAADRVPDDPTASSGSELQGFPSLHIACVPRYHWLRPS